MAVYAVTYKRYNGTSFDDIYFNGLSDLIDDSNATFNKFIKIQANGDIDPAFLTWLGTAGLDNKYLQLAGGTMAGNIDMGTNEITNASKLILTGGQYIGPTTTPDGITYRSKATGIDGAGHTFLGGDVFVRALKNVTGVSAFNITSTNIPLNISAGTNSVNITSKGTYTGDINSNGSDSLVNKGWVENLVATGTKIHEAVKAMNSASQTNLTLSGTSFALDGVALSNGDRVLIVGQDTAANNGVYQVTTNVWLKIAEDSDEGSLISVLNGATRKGQQWYKTDVANQWILYNTSQVYSQGQGIEIDGLTISVPNGGITNAMLQGSIANSKLLLNPTGALEYNGNDIRVKAAGITNAMLQGSITQAKMATYDLGPNADNTPYSGLTDTDTAISTTNRFRNLFSIIRILRGENNWNTENHKTISGAYRKTTVDFTASGTTAPARNSANPRQEGDIWLMATQEL